MAAKVRFGKASPLISRKFWRQQIFSNARVPRFDDNLTLPGKKARTHHLESIFTLENFTADMVKRFKLTIVGDLTQMALDEGLVVRRYSVETGHKQPR